MDNPVLLPPKIDEVPPPGVAIVEELDKMLMVQLRDGRKVIGILRSFDQFANLVLESKFFGNWICVSSMMLCGRLEAILMSTAPSAPPLTAFPLILFLFPQEPRKGSL